MITADRRFRLYYFAWVAFLIFLPGIVFSQPQKSNILYINSYNIGYRWSDSITSGVIKSLKNTNFNLFIECLDSKRFGQKNFKSSLDYFQDKYKDIAFRAIITSDNDALDFMFQYGDTFFPGIPVIYCGINNPEDYKLTDSRFYGFTESSDPLKEIYLLPRIVPQAKSILLITDNTTSGDVILREREKLQKLVPTLKLNIINEIDTKEIIDIVQKGTSGDIVYIMRLNRDRYGNLINAWELAEKIGNVSPNPVFCDDDATIGKGIVGGNANRGFVQGFKAGTLARQILTSHFKDSFAHVNKVEEGFIFDHKLLKKFNIRGSLLPANSKIINRPIIQNLRFILALIAIILMLSGVIVFLSITIRKRYIAEKKVTEQLGEINERNLLLEESYKQLNDLNCELEEANAQLSNLNINLELAKSKAEESEKLKSSFLANLSHEIRTPLNAILGFSSLLTTNISEEKRNQYLGIIHANSEYLLVLINDILDFSKIEAGLIEIRTEQVSVNQIFEELLMFHRERNPNPELEIRTSAFTKEHPAAIVTDKIRFKQILNNLIVNAMKFTESGFIEVGYTFTGYNEATFFVKDTGIGIAKEFHKSIFDRFRKIEDNAEKFYSGSGLGLAICKRLLELLGGRIWVESEPGKGSTFFFTHPDYIVNENIEATIRTNMPSGVSYNWKGRNIAIAEDEDTNYLLIEHIIEKEGAHIIRFKNGNTLINHLKDKKGHNIDLILMDIKMPGLNGYDALERIRLMYPKMVIIAQSAYAMPEDIRKFNEYGFNDYIIKPIKSAELKAKINKYLA